MKITGRSFIHFIKNVTALKNCPHILLKLLVVDHHNVPPAVYPLGSDRSARWRKLVASIPISTCHWKNVFLSFCENNPMPLIALVIPGQVSLPVLNAILNFLDNETFRLIFRIECTKIEINGSVARILTHRQRENQIVKVTLKQGSNELIFYSNSREENRMFNALTRKLPLSR